MSVYLAIYISGLFKIMTSREIREKGITLAGWSINYSDIRGLHWLSENKLQINYDPNVIYVFYRQFKEKWIIRDDQLDELKAHLEEHYHKPFGAGI